ncbi:hypothetical protein V1286_001645 [Bradyrhizobium algeriense]|uniref:DUF4148 domain-containing protein n=1 Tax=Bradyrhizobium algeriense TaxID=634784 RepID=A0ABU8B6F8_9BRAD
MKRTHRNRRIGVALAIALLLPDADCLVIERGSALSKTANAGDGQQVPSRTTPPARDPQLAVQEEYQLARQRGTAQALELFIARHPDSPLAEKARADLAATKR